MAAEDVTRSKAGADPIERLRDHERDGVDVEIVFLALAEEYDLVDNFCWANDYPHHEGSWPHSAEAIERQMGHLSDGSRAKILGLNAARLFGLDPT